MNESSVLVRIILAIVTIAVVFIVLVILDPLFRSIIPPTSFDWITPVESLIKVIAIFGAFWYVLTGRRTL